MSPQKQTQCLVDVLAASLMDVAVCRQSGVGCSLNRIYREDGNPQQDHDCEDRSFHINGKDTSLYGVFDAHNGTKSVDFFVQIIPEAILLGQLTPNMSDEQIIEVIRGAFSTAEEAYMNSIDNLLAKRFYLLESIFAPENKEEVTKSLKGINNEISSGSAVAIALIYNGKLYVANVGNCRVLLGLNDQNGALKVVQLSMDHNLRNEDELLRLTQLGLDELRKRSRLGNQENTRCLGNYMVKEGYKEVADLKAAIQKPIIATPDIIGGIPLSETHRFLLLMSSGLYNSVEEATSSDQVNKYIAQCVVEQFRCQATLTGVAQAVVDTISRLHRDRYDSSPSNCSMKRDDITLIVRNFNYPMPNAARSPTAPHVAFNPVVSSTVLSNTTLTHSYNSTINSNLSSTNSSSNISRVRDPNARIPAYVSFGTFYERIKEARTNGTLPNGIQL